MISRLEVYVILGLIVVAVAAYFTGDIHGHLAEARTVSARQSEADGAALAEALRQAQTLVAGDQTAAEAAQNRLNALNKGINDAVTNLGKLPPVVLDARGCEHLSNDWGLRWNTVESLPGRSPVGAADGPPGAVPARDVPPPH